MIFVTVGTQLPFDRMISVVDAWAGRSGEEVFAQIGPSQQDFPNLETADFLPPGELAKRIEESSCIVAHAGMGTILSALEVRKPLLVMPRRAELGEHRNDHQIATARKLSERGLVQVAWTDEEMLARLDGLAEIQGVASPRSEASPELLAALRGFISTR